ncbi:MAG: hypothetical protein ABEK16_04450 [Candidatus Nanohalobium sp.]
MVYEVRCDNCGDLIDFGGRNPEERPVAPQSKLPENAVEFDDNVYCEECVEKFVKAGVGDIQEEVNFLKESVEDIREELGMEKTMND